MFERRSPTARRGRWLACACARRACAGSPRHDGRPSSLRGIGARRSRRCQGRPPPAREPRARARSARPGSAGLPSGALGAARGRRAGAIGARRSRPPAGRPGLAARRRSGAARPGRRLRRAPARPRRGIRSRPTVRRPVASRPRSGGRRAPRRRAGARQAVRHASASRRARRAANPRHARSAKLERLCGRQRDRLGLTVEPGGLGSRRGDRGEALQLTGRLDQRQRLVERRPLLRIAPPGPYEADGLSASAGGSVEGNDSRSTSGGAVERLAPATLVELGAGLGGQQIDAPELEPAALREPSPHSRYSSATACSRRRIAPQSRHRSARPACTSRPASRPSSRHRPS